MCSSCWKEAGSPAIVNERTLAAAFLVNALERMPDGGVGGHLHIVTDDWNLEDEHLSFCEANIDSGEHPYPPEQERLERQIIAAFLAMSEDERYSAMALADRVIEPYDAAAPALL